MKIITLILLIVSLSSCSINVMVQGVTIKDPQRVKSPQRVWEPQQKRLIVGSAILGYSLARHLDKRTYKP